MRRGYPETLYQSDPIDILSDLFETRFDRRKLAFATNSDFIIPKSLQPNVLHLRYLKL